MKYKYSVVSGQYNLDESPTKRPIVEVEISRGNNKRKFLALVDSGADQIHMPAAIAEVFGIDRKDCRPWRSMGISMESTPGFVGELTFRINKLAEPFTAPVIFIDTSVPVLLGRECFFDQYRIRFEQDHDIFEITPVPKY
jgi:hypothetical protein